MVKNGKQIKRNVVSLIGKRKIRISGFKLAVILVSISSTCLGIPLIAQGTDLVIRQETFHYQMPFIQDIFAETFVISTVPKQLSTEAAIISKLAPTTPNHALHFAHPITVRFQIDSAKVIPAEQTRMLSLLHKLKIPRNAPLAVTGFTCKMGTSEFNDRLSEERSKAVAKLLKNEGYTIGQIEGKGASNLVSEHYAPINRRVEITLLENH